MDRPLRARNFLVVAHKFHTTPEDDLVTYLADRRAENVLHICHSFSDMPDRRSYYRWYKAGKLVKQRSTRDYAGLPEPFLYIKEFVFTAAWVLRSGVRWDRYVGLDGLCSLFALPLRFFSRVRSVAFWNIDFVPNERFLAAWKNAVYRLVNRIAAFRSDEMWDHTELMVREKERLFGLRPADYRAHRVVPLGIWTERMAGVPYDDCERNTLVFMGHLLEKQGVQLVLRAIPAIVERIPDFRFRIIGTGSYEDTAKRIVSDLGIEKYVEFVGRIDDDRHMEEEVAKCAAGVAPYMKDLDTFTQFGADPGKIKTYLGCGIPVLLTDVPWIAKSIEARGSGYIISEDIADIADKVVLVLSDPVVNQRCRDNAAKYALEFDWNAVFDRLEL